MKKLLAALTLLALPFSASAQFNAAPVGGYITSIIAFVNDYLIPLVLVAAIVIFIWGMFQYFVLGGTNEEKREKGKQLIIWGIVGFVLMLSVQGIVMLLTSTLGFGGGVIQPPTTFTP